MYCTYSTCGTGAWKWSLVCETDNSDSAAPRKASSQDWWLVCDRVNMLKSQTYNSWPQRYGWPGWVEVTERGSGRNLIVKWFARMIMISDGEDLFVGSALPRRPNYPDFSGSVQSYLILGMCVFCDFDVLSFLTEVTPWTDSIARLARSMNLTSPFALLLLLLESLKPCW